MQTNLAPEFQGTPDGEAAEAILRKCVHCGFCTATCPTYQLLGDELDGPRGRIYLIKQVLEGDQPTASTQLHLDRCLTCRNCETTCPSGVQYGQLIDIGRRVVEARVPRVGADRAMRVALREGMTSPLFSPALKLGQLMRPLLPAALKSKVPPRGTAAERERAHQWPNRQHDRKVLMLMGCVQPALAPNINSATARVLDAVGIQTLVADGAGCCGAIREHLSDHDGALANMRRNVDAWWPLIEQQSGRKDVKRGIEAIVMTASGCGVTVKDYGHALRHDKAYADRARQISALTRDISELLPAMLPMLKTKMALRRGSVGGKTTPSNAGLGSPSSAAAPAAMRVAFHPPCTLQHGQQLRGGVEDGLRELGFDVSLASNESHLCCGSAGTYSVTQPELSKALRDRKLKNLEPTQPQVIASANVGCIQHLQTGTTTRVAHWIELVDEALVAG
jgi:glycolate oxidase iron-sulfur subunit